ncbi:hypothetical protein Hamer_G031860 [Homarus americanus]|uniref:Uncharacterized protein n=1 Tax=Homarus americanus TaxID=6706 RepID=A0A8J5N135_HOMAM|nr:hypothetical protein Hamer_G031860 [Homarus americanus]
MNGPHVFLPITSTKCYLRKNSHHLCFTVAIHQFNQTL